MTLRNRLLNMHPATLVLTSFLVVIALGVLLLMLPMATVGGRISWVDALFTASSAVCVTGLTVVDTGSYFTVFGQLVILLLIQIGALGLMTISVALFQWIGANVSFRQRMAMQSLFAHTPRKDIFGLVRNVVLFTLAAEAVGALLLTLFWSREFALADAFYNGVFHSISAFCNAGFALFPDSFMRYDGDIPLNAIICGLIVLGGIGFPVLYDLQSWFARRGSKRVRLSIQTKAVLTTTLVLIVLGALMFAFLEQKIVGDGQGGLRSLLVPMFQSITCRTAGFNTVDISSLKDATLAMMLVLMFFGASPGSTGGGVKTTTLALLAVFTISRVRKQRRVNVFKKSIPNETVSRSLSLIILSVGIIGLVLFMLLADISVSGAAATSNRGAFLPYLFETVSAFGTVGLSMGVTSTLDTWGKCWITVMMIVGRIGVLTFSYIIVGAGAVGGVEYSEENLMIG